MERTPSSKAGPSKWRKVMKTVVLVGAWVCIGLNLEITGPTLKDIILRTGSSYEKVSRVVSGRSVGFFIGAAVGGFLVDKLGRYLDVMIAVCLELMGVASVIIPYTPLLTAMSAIFIAQGVFEGIINIAGQKLILELWLEKASSPLHVLHLGFGIGSFLVPQIANPFLAVPSTSYNVNETLTNISTPHSTNIVTYIKESRIEWPFLIVGLIPIVLSIVFHYYQFYGKSVRNFDKPSDTQQATLTFKEIIDPGTCTNGNRFYGTQLFLFMFLFFFQAVGGERLYGKFIRSFAIDHHKMNGDSASILNTVFWVGFSVGRFIGFILARWIPIRVLLLTECLGGLVIAILLNVFAVRSTLALWILTVPMGMFIAPCFPSGVGWTDHHVKMTGFGITFLILGGSLGGVCYLWTIGYFYDSSGPLSFLYMMAAYGILLCLFAFVLHCISRGKGTRFKSTIYDVSTKTTEELSNEITEEGVPLKDKMNETLETF